MARIFKKLETGISTSIVNGRVEVFTESEMLKIEQKNWWQKVLKKNQLNQACNMTGFMNWFEKIKSIHVISNDEFERINKKFN